MDALGDALEDISGNSSEYVPDNYSEDTLGVVLDASGDAPESSSENFCEDSTGYLHDNSSEGATEDAPADVLEIALGVALEDEPENSSEDLLVDAPEDSNPVASHEH